MQGILNSFRSCIQSQGVVLKFLFAGRGIALFYGIIPFVYLAGNAIWAFLLLLFLSVSLSSIANNAWIAWISNTIPVKMRGRFFSIRSRYLMLTAIAVTYIFSLFIDYFTEAAPSGRIASLFVQADLPYGFAVVFFIATVAGVSGAFSGIAMMTTMLISGAFLPGPVEIKGFHLEPEQALFSLTGIARWSAQIPLSWIHEPRARPIGEALSSFIREIRPKIMK